MNDSGECVRRLSTRNLIIGVLVIFVILVVGLFWLVFGQESPNQLRPLLPPPTTSTQSVNEEIKTISFTELNDDPLAYLDKPILVSGEFLSPETEDCESISGPDIRWSLAADNLQLDVLGFERIIHLLPDGSNMTVEGIWRLYQGPLGCGKAPPSGSLWYLDAKKIIQPNPLVGAGGQTIQVEIRNNEFELPSILQTMPSGGSDPIPTQTPIVDSSTMTIPPSPTNSGEIIPTMTPPVPGEATPTFTPSPAPTNGLPTNTPDPNSTESATTASPTAIPTDNPGNSTPTLTSEAPPVPATATEGSGGYPGPESSPTASATPDPYP